MPLFEDFRVPCVILINSQTSDGQGGTETTWSNGESFNASIVLSSSKEVGKADGHDAKNTYEIVSSRVLEYGEVFKRVSDSKAFKVISDESLTPDVASFSFSKSTAVECDLNE